MPILKLTGAVLSYTIHGTSGPVVIFITGAGGDGLVWQRLADVLKDKFQVITYDRRGHSRSFLSGEQDYSQRLETDADDAAALVSHISNDGVPAYVFGNSSGAIVAMMLLLRHGSKFKKVVLHEPPLFDAMENPGEMLHLQHEMYDLYRAKGHVAALQHFSSDALTPEEMTELQTISNPMNNPYTAANFTYWFEREFLQYPPIKVDWIGLEAVKHKFIIGLSELAPQCTGGRGAVGLGNKLDIEPEIFPGGHIGFITHPTEFAEEVSKVLQ